MIYLVSFSVSVLLAFFANKTTNRRNFYIFSICSILVMVLLAGLRDYKVGTDTYNFLIKKMYWNGAVSADSFFGYLKYYFPLGYGEPLFAILVGFIAQVTGNFTVFLIVCHTVILACVYIGVFRLRQYVNPAFVLLLYYLLYFNHTLNMIRQHMAMAIVFLALADIINKKHIRFCLFVLLATLFHTTALIGLGLLAVYWIINLKVGKLKNIGTKQRFYFTGISLSAIVLLFAPIINMLVKIGLLNKRYLFFLKSDKVDPALIATGVVAIGLIAVFIFRKEIAGKFKNSNFFILSSICYFILLQLSLTVAYGKRIALHFALADLITWGIVEKAQENKKKQWIVRIAAVGICLIYWTYIYAIKNAGKTFPYLFFFQ